MSETKHTPGPWRVSTDDRIYSPAGFYVATIYDCIHEDGTPNRELTSANAHLIAAAPDLLEALEGLDREASGLLEALRVRDGDSADWDNSAQDRAVAITAESLWASVVEARRAIAKAKGGEK